MDIKARAAAVGIAAAALTMLAACGSDDSDGGSGSGDGGGLTITSPADGAVVDTTFDVAWDSDVELGEPDTGRDHVHVFVDGHSNDYTVVGGNSFTIEDLSPGKHEVDVTLQHADHSSAGQEDEIEVMVEPGAQPSAPSSSSAPEDDDMQGDQPDSGLGY